MEPIRQVFGHHHHQHGLFPAWRPQHDNPRLEIILELVRQVPQRSRIVRGHGFCNHLYAVDGTNIVPCLPGGGRYQLHLQLLQAFFQAFVAGQQRLDAPHQAFGAVLEQPCGLMKGSVHLLDMV